LQDGRLLDLLTNERSDQVHFAVLDGRRSLKLEEAHSSDSGTYSCVATNLAGHANAEITLDVLLSPYFEDFSYKQEEMALAGTKVKFDCTVSGNPEPRVSTLSLYTEQPYRAGLAALIITESQGRHFRVSC
jgi:hemicentin